MTLTATDCIESESDGAKLTLFVFGSKRAHTNAPIVTGVPPAPVFQRLSIGRQKGVVSNFELRESVFDLI